MGVTLTAGPPPIFNSQLQAHTLSALNVNASESASNSPPMVWVPVQIPSGALVMAFDFAIIGNPFNDVMVCGVGTNNLFSLEAQYIPTNSVSASRLIDISAWAGTTNELFFGLMGGASTNVSLQIDNIRFYGVPSPVSDFGADTATGNAPLQVTFTDASTGTITNRHWDFGDGTTANLTATSVAHIYNLAGSNDVTLIVSGPGGASTNSKPSYIIVTSTNAPPPDTSAPTLTVLTPLNYQTFTTNGITVTGLASDTSGINGVTVNGVNASVVGTNWSFSYNLAVGTNTLTVIATDSSANLNTSTQTVHAVFSPSAPPDTTPPALAITAPTNFQVFTNAGITLLGTAADSSGIAGVTVNGQPASVVSSNWSRAYTLVTGTNNITVIATDNSPNLNTKTQIVQVVFSPPPVDTTPPALTIIAPTNLQVFTNAGITVSGTVSDSSGIAGVRVNGLAGSVVGTNWTRAYTLSVGTNTLTVIAVDNSAGLNTATQTVQAVLNPPPPTNHPPQIGTIPTVTNALLQVGNVAAVLFGETNVFTVTATDADGDPLTYFWTFGDGTTSGATSPVSTVSHAYTATNCGPYAASVSVSDGLVATSSNLTVTVACELPIASLQTKLNFAKPNADSAKLKATPQLTDCVSLAGKVVTLDIGGAQLAFTLDAKGRGINAQGKGTCRFTHKAKTGVCTFTATLSHGSWANTWATHGLANTTIPKPGTVVTLPVILLVGDEAFMADKTLNYTAKINKSGTAK